MPFTMSDLDIRVPLPDLPPVVPMATLPAPCLSRHSEIAQELGKALGLDLQSSADVPHGYAVGGRRGQVEVFSASGAVRARNTEQLSRFEDERRQWADVRREESDAGIVYRLSDDTERRLAGDALRLLRSAGLVDDHASLRVTLGQWALLDESGTEVDSGPGRATVQLGYAAHGIRLIGAGAKTNVHFDPDDTGQAGVVARLFHVNRGFDGSKDVRLLDLEQAFQPLLTQTWSGRELDPGSARISISAIDYGLLALPADVVQRFAAPALAVEGRITGVDGGDGREMELRFAQYLPLTDADALAEAGFASSGRLIPGSVVKGKSKGE
jgi:hypothetical protein